jgi:hypothetical protein
VWAFNQAYFYAGLDLWARALEEIGHPRAAECRSAARALRASIERSAARAATLAPLVPLRDHTWSRYVPAELATPRRLFDAWYPTDVDTGPLHLARLGALPADGELAQAMLDDHEDNLFLKGWGMANEPVYNQQATVYLRRDEVKPVVRAFYSMMACAFSHSVLEPVEHRWGWGQYFGPPSTDGAWFELYRHMLIHERDDGALLLGQAAPRAWLARGPIQVERAPTYFGPITFTMARAGDGLRAEVQMPVRRRPPVLLVRLRHPDQAAMNAVTVNGRTWSDFDPKQEWVRIPAPAEARYTIVASYGANTTSTQ